MKITVETEQYNHRRYGLPWIAVVDFTDPQGSFRFGDFVGGRRGEDGLLVIDAPAGAIICHGQKDQRGGRGSGMHWFQVQPDGLLSSELGGKAESYRLFTAAAAPPSGTVEQFDPCM